MGSYCGKAPETGKVVRAYFQRVLNEKDLSACDAMLSEDYVDHDAPPDTPPGPASVKAFLAGFIAQYPDLHVEIADLITAGNRAAARMVWRGTDRQTGALYHRMGIVMLRLNDWGQLVERWSAYDGP